MQPPQPSVLAEAAADPAHRHHGRQPAWPGTRAPKQAWFLCQTVDTPACIYSLFVWVCQPVGYKDEIVGMKRLLSPSNEAL